MLRNIFVDEKFPSVFASTKYRASSSNLDYGNISPSGSKRSWRIFITDETAAARKLSTVDAQSRDDDSGYNDETMNHQQQIYTGCYNCVLNALDARMKLHFVETLTIVSPRRNRFKALF